MSQIMMASTNPVRSSKNTDNNSDDNNDEAMGKLDREQQHNPVGFGPLNIASAPATSKPPAGKPSRGDKLAKKSIPDHSCTYISRKYTDYAGLYESCYHQETRKVRSGASRLFPERLHAMLELAEQLDFTDIISWQPHGRAFVVRNQKRFLNEILPRYFKVSKFESFLRQLNLYSFARIRRKGPDHGAYYHEQFLRGMPALCIRIERDSTVGKGQQSFCPIDKEPDFYKLPYLPLSGFQGGSPGVGKGLKTKQQPKKPEEESARKPSAIHVKQEQKQQASPDPTRISTGETKASPEASAKRGTSSSNFLGEAIDLASAPEMSEGEETSRPDVQIPECTSTTTDSLDHSSSTREDDDAVAMAVPVAADVLAAIDYRIFDD